MDDTSRTALIDPTLLTPGRRVRVVKQMQLKGWTTETVGAVQAYEQRKTGSWYAHGKDDKLWLDRLVLELDDGEIVTLNLDGYSRVEAANESSGNASDQTTGLGS
ncbi:MAG: hypothetical protein AAF663_03265 [Planctomycetota bacterium]